VSTWRQCAMASFIRLNFEFKSWFAIYRSYRFILLMAQPVYVKSIRFSCLGYKCLFHCCCNERILLSRSTILEIKENFVNTVTINIKAIKIKIFSLLIFARYTKTSSNVSKFRRFLNQSFFCPIIRVFINWCPWVTSSGITLKPTLWSVFRCWKLTPSITLSFTVNRRNPQSSN
jgi:hypothetical protein